MRIELLSAILITSRKEALMRKLEVKDSDIMRIAVHQEILRSEESRYDHRLHGILLICSGFSTYNVAELFGHSPRTIQYWVNRFEESGFAGLEETTRPGRPGNSPLAQRSRPRARATLLPSRGPQTDLPPVPAGCGP